MMNDRYLLTVFVPSSHLDGVKQALFDAGAGRQDNYEHCSFQSLGEGQYRPGAGSQPFEGEVGKLSRVEEYKLELLCDAASIQAAVKALLVAHPYESPAYAVLAMVDI